MSTKPRPESVVDYNAWNRGYMPPSEHILIDQLSYRGARVVSATDFGANGAIWIVTRDLKTLKPETRKKLREIIDMVFDDLLPEPVAPTDITGGH